MQIKALLILAFSSDALSLPPPGTASSTLEKRNSFGWIGSHGEMDTECKNGVVGGETRDSRPKIRDDHCIEWNNTTPRIGLDWGAGRYTAFDTIRLYRSSGCHDTLADVTSNHEFGACFLMSDICAGDSAEGGPCFVRSVRALALFP